MRRQKYTPTDLVAEAVALVIERRWHDLRDSGSLAQTNRHALEQALRYLSKLEFKVEHEGLSAHPSFEETYERSQQSVEPSEPSQPSFLNRIGNQMVKFLAAFGVLLFVPLLMILVGASVTYQASYPDIFHRLVGGLLYVLLGVEAMIVILFVVDPILNWLFERCAKSVAGKALANDLSRLAFALIICVLTSFALVETNGQLSGNDGTSGFVQWFQLLATLGLLLTLLFGRDLAGGYRYASAGGISSHLDWVWRSEAKRDAQIIKDVLFSQASQQFEGGKGRSESSGEENAKQPDEKADIAVPAPPGITEIVLDSAGYDAFVEMRQHLSNARQFHRTVLWTLVLAFLSFFGVALYKLLMNPKSFTDWAQAMGSAGIGGGLLWFAERALWNNRISQLSLALLESYIAEARDSLKEIPSSSPFEDRRRMRGKVWQSFRLGLNEIWLSEQQVADTGVRPGRHTTKSTNAPTGSSSLGSS